MIRGSLMIVSIGLILIACSNSQEEEANCTQVMAPGIVVEIRDAISDAPIAEHAVVVITDGGYQETMIPYESEGPDSASLISLQGALERPGIYDINLSLSSYEGWSRTGVEVEDSICHVNTVRFTVRLEAIK